MRQTVLKKLREKLAKLDRLFEEYVSLLARTYPESTILLFGSRARGNNLPYSDYDLMIIVKLRDSRDRLTETVKAYSLKPVQLPIDLLVVDLEELDDPIVLKMLERGCVILYDGLRIADRLASICGKEDRLKAREGFSATPPSGS